MSCSPRHVETPRTGQRQTTWQSLHEGVAYVRNTPAVLLVILVVGLVLLFGSNFNVVLPLLATDVLHVGANGLWLSLRRDRRGLAARVAVAGLEQRGGPPSATC